MAFIAFIEKSLAILFYLFSQPLWCFIKIKKRVTSLSPAEKKSARSCFYSCSFL